MQEPHVAVLLVLAGSTGVALQMAYAGEGVPEAFVPELFEPFTQASVGSCCACPRTSRRTATRVVGRSQQEQHVAVNAELTGKEYPSYTYEVSREKIREYATALGETDPRYFSDGDDCVAPPTFAAAYTITKGGAPLFGDPDLGMHWNLVHGSQRYEFGRAVRPGDVLTCTPRFAGVAPRGGNEFVSMEVECRHADGELAVLSTATIVLFGSAPEEA